MTHRMTWHRDHFLHWWRASYRAKTILESHTCTDGSTALARHSCRWNKLGFHLTFQTGHEIIVGKGQDTTIWFKLLSIIKCYPHFTMIHCATSLCKSQVSNIRLLMVTVHNNRHNQMWWFEMHQVLVICYSILPHIDNCFWHEINQAVSLNVVGLGIANSYDEIYKPVQSTMHR